MRRRLGTPGTLRTVGSVGVSLVVPPPDIELLTSAEVAGWLGVARRTVQTWTQTGALTSFVTPGGHRRFHRADIARVAAEMGITRPPSPATPPSPSSNGDGDGARRP